MARPSMRGGLVGVTALGISVLAIALAANVGGSPKGLSVAGAFALVTLAGIAALTRLMQRYLARAGVAASVAVLDRIA